MTKVLHAVVRGRVQGVGFRAFASRRATALALGGWASNRADGAVEVEACGPRPALEALLEALRDGPSAARVDDVIVHWSECDSAPPEFRIR
jgi:acylphosphatase